MLPKGPSDFGSCFIPKESHRHKLHVVLCEYGFFKESWLSFLISPPLYFYLWRDIFFPFLFFFFWGGGWPHNDQLSSETLNCDYIGGCCMLREGCSMYRPNDIPEYVMYRWQSVSMTQNMSRALTKEH